LKTRKQNLKCAVLSLVVALSGYQSHAHSNAILSVPSLIPVLIMASRVVKSALSTLCYRPLLSICPEEDPWVGRSCRCRQLEAVAAQCCCRRYCWEHCRLHSCVSACQDNRCATALCLTWRRIVRVVVVGSRACLVLRLDVLVVGRSAVTDGPPSAVVRIVTVLAASSSRKASRQKVSTSFYPARAKLTRRGRIERRRRRLCRREAPSDPSGSRCCCSCCHSSYRNHVSTKVKRIGNDERVMQIF
jgi:hypothetical protein